MRAVLTMTPPAAQASNPGALRKKYLKDDLIPVVPAYASQTLSNLLLRLLKKDPKKRISFSECARRDGSAQPAKGQDTDLCPCS